jgi:hypothetical protein
MFLLLEVNMRIILMVVVVMFQITLAVGQESHTGKSSQSSQLSPVTERRILELPRPQRKQPKITLQQALKIAEGYIKKEKIDISSYYLFEAKWILYGTDVKELGWYFWWVNVDGALGNYVQLTVSMDGKVQLLGSM